MRGARPWWRQSGAFCLEAPHFRTIRIGREEVQPVPADTSVQHPAEATYRPQPNTGLRAGSVVVHRGPLNQETGDRYRKETKQKENGRSGR